MNCELDTLRSVGWEILMWRGLGSNDGPEFECRQGQEIIFPSALTSIPAVKPTMLPIQCAPGCYTGRGPKLAAHIRLVPSLNMSGATPRLPLYAFAACTSS